MLLVSNCIANIHSVPNLFSHPNRFRRADWGASFPKGEAKGAVSASASKINFPFCQNAVSPRPGYGTRVAYYLGMVMVRTIWLSVSRRSETAPMPESWIFARDWVRVLRKADTFALASLSRGWASRLST